MPADGPVVQTVALAGVFKDYGEKRALSDVSLMLEAGQVLALLGENGAGKSTLLGVLAQQIRPTRGKLLFDGRDVSDLDGRWLRQNLSLLSHEPRCYADLSARENLTFFAKLYGVGSDGLNSLGTIPVTASAAALAISMAITTKSKNWILINFNFFIILNISIFVSFYYSFRILFP